MKRIKNVLEFTSRGCCVASGTSRKLLHEDVAMYEKRLGIYRKKMLQPISNATSWTLHQEDVTTITTYQECLGSYPKEMLQRLRKVLEMTARKCENT